jgi:hypothetical protein
MIDSHVITDAVVPTVHFLAYGAHEATVDFCDILLVTTPAFILVGAQWQSVVLKRVAFRARTLLQQLYWRCRSGRWRS